MNEANVRALLQSPVGPVVRTVERYTRRTANVARATAPADTGHLRASVTSGVHNRGSSVVGRVSSSLDYAIYQEKGTGIYAGKGPIRPKKAKVLAFRPKGSAKMVFAKEVKGTPATHFLEKALRTSVPWPVHRGRV